MVLGLNFYQLFSYILITRLIGVSLYEWKELKKIIPLFEEREPELTIDNVENKV